MNQVMMTYEQGYRTHVDLLRYRTVPDYTLKEFVLRVYVYTHTVAEY